jgi:hypothetical protein
METAHPCPHRTSAHQIAQCRLVGDFVANIDLCGVHESLCAKCLEKGPPELAAPNPYLASIAYKAADAQARAAKAAADKPRWFHWAGLAHFFRAHLMRAPRPAAAEAAERPKLCEHLGAVQERQSCNCPRKHRYKCERFTDAKGALPLLVSPANECERCQGYEPADDI